MTAPQTETLTFVADSAMRIALESRAADSGRTLDEEIRYAIESYEAMANAIALLVKLSEGVNGNNARVGRWCLTILAPFRKDGAAVRAASTMGARGAAWREAVAKPPTEEEIAAALAI